MDSLCLVYKVKIIGASMVPSEVVLVVLVVLVATLEQQFLSGQANCVLFVR